MTTKLRKKLCYIKYCILILLIIARVDKAFSLNRNDININKLSIYNIDSLYYISLVDSSFIEGEKGNYENSISYLKKAIKLYPDSKSNILLLNNIAGIYQLLGKYDDAINYYTDALNKNPNELTIRYNRALLYAKISNDKAALTDYSILIGLNPNNQLYKYQRAMIYILQKEYDLAYNDIMDILDKDSSSLKARAALAMIETLRGNYVKAEQLYDYLIEKLPNNANIYEGRANLFFEQKKMGFAVRDINKAIDLAKSKATASMYLLRSKIFQAMGDEVQANKDLKVYSELNKNSFHKI